MLLMPTEKLKDYYFKHTYIVKNRNSISDSFITSMRAIYAVLIVLLAILLVIYVRAWYLYGGEFFNP